MNEMRRKPLEPAAVPLGCSLICQSAFYAMRKYGPRIQAMCVAKKGIDARKGCELDEEHDSERLFRRLGVTEQTLASARCARD
jgi:hypothetical protein